MWPDFGCGDVRQVVSLRSYEKLFPCLAVPIPAGFSVDVSLAKAENVRNAGDAPGVTDLTRQKSYCAVGIGTREVKGGNM